MLKHATFQGWLASLLEASGFSVSKGWHFAWRLSLATVPLMAVVFGFSYKQAWLIALAAIALIGEIGLLLYLSWAKQYNLVTANELAKIPTLVIKFDRNDPRCFHKTHIGTVPACFIRLDVNAIRSMVPEVSGFVLRALKYGNGGWIETSLVEELALVWAMDDIRNIDIFPNSGKMLNVLFITEHAMQIYGTRVPNYAVAAFNFNDTFRIDVRVNTKSGQYLYAYLIVKVGNNWENPETLEMYNEPL